MEKNTSGLTLTLSGRQIEAHRPEPILDNLDVVACNKDMEPQVAVEAILEGYQVLVTDFYSTGIKVLNALKKFIQTQHKDDSFKGQRDFRQDFYEHSQQLLLLVRDNALTVKKAPEIGWLTSLYPDLQEFLLPFPQVQGLNSSWQWYVKGISIPGLHNKIHPFYGTYFPTRFEHLKLFGHWLKQYKGAKNSAIDIGIGSGVLAFQLLKHKFKKVYGGDSNPNCIIGLNEFLTKNEQYQKIELFYGDLFDGCTEKTELIVFNPPWLPSTSDLQGLDKSIYYDTELFPRFFEEAKKHLSPDGKIALLFSNLARITKLSDVHPIEEELLHGGRFEKEQLLTRPAGPPSKKTKRKQTWRDEEMVELWILKKSKLVN